MDRMALDEDMHKCIVTPIAIPFELVLIIGIAVDVVLALMGINIYKSIRKRLKSARPHKEI
jgi:hypothetical protein